MIYERFNDMELRFSNDQILEVLREEGRIDDAITIDDIEPHFREIRDRGLVRDIGENFTTIWFKLFDTMEKAHCGGCGDVHLGTSEQKVCPGCDESL